MFGFTATAQEFRAGFNVGLPTGDAGDAYTFALGADLSYMWNVSDTFDAGLAAGYSHFMLDGDFEGDDASFLPIAVAGRFAASEDFSIGADLGYGIGISPDGNDGGFYYRPVLGYNLSESMQLTGSYRGVSVDGGTFSSVTLGLNFAL
ncbi:MAG: hypothetical protein HKO92_01270 [Flavobacteriaceae bacterium]|nr:hypothetical protein [Flavobacteriaceae bacterium]